MKSTHVERIPVDGFVVLNLLGGDPLVAPRRSRQTRLRVVVTPSVPTLVVITTIIITITITMVLPLPPLHAPIATFAIPIHVGKGHHLSFALRV
jgi:hypothetical protein